MYITIAVVLGVGMVIGMYVVSQIERHIGKNTLQENLDKIDRELVDDPDKFIPYIKGDYCDRCQEHKTDEEHVCLSCCGDDISDEDIQICPTCKEHV